MMHNILSRRYRAGVRVDMCQKFAAAVQPRSLAMLDNTLTMDETIVSYHPPPKTKKQSKTVDKKEKPGPIKANVNADRTKQMLPGFFDS
jgi:hypothetical protein